MSAMPLPTADKMPSTSAHSQRLKLVRDEAARIRTRLNHKEITPEEAVEQLDTLKRKYLRFIDRLIDA